MEAAVADVSRYSLEDTGKTPTITEYYISHDAPTLHDAPDVLKTYFWKRHRTQWFLRPAINVLYPNLGWEAVKYPLLLLKGILGNVGTQQNFKGILILNPRHSDSFVSCFSNVKYCDITK